MKKRHRAVEQLALQMFDLTKRMWFQTQREKFKGGYDLSESEFLALDALEEVPSRSVGELRRYVGVLPAQMSRIIKALEQRYDEKLVVCAINPKDKRKVDVAITPKGRRAVAAYRRAKITASAKALYALPARDLGALAGILNRIERATSKGPSAGSARPVESAT